VHLRSTGCFVEGDVTRSNPLEDYIEAIEGKGPRTTLFALLARHGVPVPHPDEVVEADITSAVWKVIHALADERVILDCTNHLSDRELYSLLWTRFLREDHPAIPDHGKVTTHIDMLGSWTNEDVQTYLRYYAEEESRQNWVQNFHEKIPEHVDPPYDRDRFLPGH
jgi:hypothetical protein